jgi:hypothetical protein
MRQRGPGADVAVLLQHTQPGGQIIDRFDDPALHRLKCIPLAEVLDRVSLEPTEYLLRNLGLGPGTHLVEQMDGVLGAVLPQRAGRVHRVERDGGIRQSADLNAGWQLYIWRALGHVKHSSEPEDVSLRLIGPVHAVPQVTSVGTQPCLDEGEPVVEESLRLG